MSEPQPCPFSAKELDDKSVEYQLPLSATGVGWLRAIPCQGGLVLVGILTRGVESALNPKPLVLPASLIQRHPDPRIADFLWVEQEFDMSAHRRDARSTTRLGH